MFSGMNANSHAVVVGAGAVGLACALELQRRGFAVTIVDADRDGSAASWGCAGHLASEQVAPLASIATLRGAWGRRYARGGPVDLRDVTALAPWIARFVRASSPWRHRRGHAALRALLAHALPAWRRLAADAVREAGHFVVWESERSAARGRAGWSEADIGTATCGPISDADTALIARVLPDRALRGYRFGATGQVTDLPGLARTLWARFKGGWIASRASALRLHGARASVVLDDGGKLDADRVVVCAGVDSGALMRTIGERAPLVAERGYHVQWRDHDWPAALPPVVFEDRSVIATRFDSGLRLAGFCEFARRDTPPDATKWDRLERHARELGLPVRGAPSRWFGARPTLPDYLPAIGRSRAAASVLYAFGHQHLGLTLAAITGELVGALARDEAPRVALHPFDLARFA